MNRIVVLLSPIRLIARAEAMPPTLLVMVVLVVLSASRSGSAFVFHTCSPSSPPQSRTTATSSICVMNSFDNLSEGALRNINLCGYTRSRPAAAVTSAGDSATLFRHASTGGMTMTGPAEQRCGVRRATTGKDGDEDLERMVQGRRRCFVQVSMADVMSSAEGSAKCGASSWASTRSAQVSTPVFGSRYCQKCGAVVLVRLTFSCFVQSGFRNISRF